MEAYRAIIQQAIRNIDVVVQSLLEINGLLCVKLEARFTSFFFWSDGVNLPKNGTFVLNGKTGDVVRGSKYIKRVTTAHCPNTLPWPSDDPHCTVTQSCAVYIELSKVRSAKNELRTFLFASLGEKGKRIVVVDYPR